MPDRYARLMPHRAEGELLEIRHENTHLEQGGGNSKNKLICGARSLRVTRESLNSSAQPRSLARTPLLPQTLANAAQDAGRRPNEESGG